MRLVLVLLAVVAILLDPLAGQGGLARAAAGLDVSHCIHAGDHIHAVAQSPPGTRPDTSQCSDAPGACPDMNDCRYPGCAAAAVAHHPITWRAQHHAQPREAGREDIAAGTVVPPLLEPPRTET